MQVLNVAMGGTLVQDIPSQVTGALEHSVPQPRVHIAHEVWVSKGSRLSSCSPITWRTARPATSTAAIISRSSDVATGFDVTATSPDGVVEAMEKPGRALLRRRAVAPGEFLAHGRVPRVVSRAWSRPLTSESDDRLDVRGVREQVERAHVDDAGNPNRAAAACRAQASRCRTTRRPAAARATRSRRRSPPSTSPCAADRRSPWTTFRAARSRNPSTGPTIACDVGAGRVALQIIGGKAIAFDRGDCTLSRRRRSDAEQTHASVQIQDGHSCRSERRHDRRAVCSRYRLP